MQSSDFPEFIDRYKIKDRLGKGGQGVVYLAHDPNLDIQVAVKVLSSDNPDFVERFKLDARVLARLNAPNIVRIFDFNPNYPYLVMEHCSEGDLNDQIKVRRPQTLTRIVDLVRQITQALIVAHEQPEPILHRDLKPGNVLFDNRVAKVTDFGLAKVLGDQSSGMTMSQGMMGTAAYASPEQLQDASKVDHRTDLWAVGVILYELMTFRGPFESTDDDNVFQTAMRVVQAVPAVPTYTMPQPIWEVIERSLQKPREKRFASARELTQALDAALASVSEAERNATYPPDTALGELDHLARRTADSMDAGNLEAARECVASMKKLSKEASVTRYWARRLPSEGGADRRSGSSSTGAASGSGSLASIDRLTSQNRFADARRECGKLLVAEPDNDAVHDRLMRITAEERELNQAVQAARDAAAQAGAASDLERVVAIWSALDQQYPGYGDVADELSRAVTERDRRAREGHRDQAQAAAMASEQAGDLAAALAVLDEFLTKYPQDPSLTPLREKIRATHSAQTQQERVSDLRAAAHAVPREQPAAALAAWQALLKELPTDEEAHRETERIRQAVSTQKLASAVADTEALAAPHLAVNAFGPALAVWRELQQLHPGDAGVGERIAALEEQERDYRKRTLVEALDKQIHGLADASESGRYAACKGAAEEIERVLRAARVALRGDIEALTTAAQQLTDAHAAAEQALTRRLQSFRAELLRQLHEAIELVPGQPSTEAEKRLQQARGELTGNLCRADILGARGNPLQQLDAARGVIEAAIQGVATERRAETDKARERSDAALQHAEKAMQRLAVSASAATPVGRELAEQIERLREKSASRSVAVLDQVTVAATELAQRALRARVHGEWDRLQQVQGALREARELLAAGATGQLESRVRDAASQAISEKASAQKQDQALNALRQEIQAQRKTLDEVLAGATRVWQQAVLRTQNLGSAVSDELKARIKASIKTGETLAGAELDAAARRLGALVSRAELEMVWATQAATFRGIEGSSQSPQISELVAEFRAAAARGDTKQMRSLGARIGEEGGAGEETPLAVPRIGSRMRRLNQRLLPAALQTYDDSLAALDRAASSQRSDPSDAAFAATQAYRALVHPAPAWPRWAAVAAGVAVIATVVTLAMPRSGPATVRLVSLSGTVRLQNLQRDGAATASPGEMSVGPQGTIWQVEAGEYIVTTEHGATVRFRVPGDETVLVPAAAVDHSDDLAERLGLREFFGDP